MFDNLNDTQKDLLGWLAALLDSNARDKYENEHNRMASGWHDMMNGNIKDRAVEIDHVKSACYVCGISGEQIEATINGQRKGLRNHNRLSYKAYYE